MTWGWPDVAADDVEGFETIGLAPVPRARHPQAQRPTGVGAEKEVGGVADPQQPPHHPFGGAAPRHVSQPALRRDRADPGAQLPVGVARLGRVRPPRQGASEALAVLGGQRAGIVGEIAEPGGAPTGVVELAQLLRGHHLVPVGLLPLARGGEQPVEEPGRRRVGDVARQVLAADEVHMVDAQVHRRHLVAGRATAAGPLDQAREPAPQRVLGLEEGQSVGEGGGELGVEPPRGRQGVELVPRGVGDLELFGTPLQGAGKVLDAERAECGGELGDRGAVIGHGERRAGSSRARRRARHAGPVSQGRGRAMRSGSGGPLRRERRAR